MDDSLRGWGIHLETKGAIPSSDSDRDHLQRIFNAMMINVAKIRIGDVAMTKSPLRYIQIKNGGSLSSWKEGILRSM